MTITLVDGKVINATSLREEKIVGNPTYWSLRFEATDLTSSDIETELVADNIATLIVATDETTLEIDGYSSVESANVVYNPITLKSTCVVRLKKEVI